MNTQGMQYTISINSIGLICDRGKTAMQKQAVCQREREPWKSRAVGMPVDVPNVPGKLAATSNMYHSRVLFEKCGASVRTSRRSFPRLKAQGICQPRPCSIRLRWGLRVH